MLTHPDPASGTSHLPLAGYHDHIRHDVLDHVTGHVTGHVPGHGQGHCGNVLDFGGGIGATAMFLKAIGQAHRAGVADMVANEGALQGLDFAMTGNLNDPAFIHHIYQQHGPFDTILALDILEHLLDPWSVVSVLQEALVPGGRLIISVPNARSYKLVLPLLFLNRWTYRDAGILDRTHIRFFVRSTACELVTDAGLKVEKTAASTYGSRMVRLFRLLTLGLLNSFTDRQYIVIARKV
ncbi:MAG: class I SAM-dependent methyltransferase [Sphingomonadaceae bacterium]